MDKVTDIVNINPNTKPSSGVIVPNSICLQS